MADAADPSAAREPSGAAAPPPRTAARSAGRVAGAALQISTWRLLLWLAGDLLSTPFHLLAFVLTRSRHRREFRRALESAAP